MAKFKVGDKVKYVKHIPIEDEPVNIKNELESIVGKEFVIKVVYDDNTYDVEKMFYVLYEDELEFSEKHRAYEEYFSQAEAMTIAEERLFNFLEDNFIEPLWSIYTEDKRSKLDELISDLKEEFYLAGKTFQKQEDKRKFFNIIEDAAYINDIYGVVGNRTGEHKYVSVKDLHDGIELLYDELKDIKLNEEGDVIYG